MGYTAPITIYYDEIGREIVKAKEDYILAEVRNALKVDIDKEELIKALQYDREQYEKGFADGMFECQKRGKWDMSTGIAICTVCGKAPSEFYIDGSENWRYCPNCGARNEEVEE